MHRALGIPEIVELIVGSITADSVREARSEEPLDRATRHTLYGLSTLSHVFSEPVLDTLWERSTPWRLGLIMSADMVHVQITGGGIQGHDTDSLEGYHRAFKVLDAQPGMTRYLIQFKSAQSIDIESSLVSERFHHYSRRVRQLARSSPTSRFPADRVSQRNVDHPVILAWQKARALLFPALRHLHIELPGTEAMSMLRFVSPAITSISMAANVYDSNLNFEQLLPEDMSQRCSGLVHFTSNFDRSDRIASQKITTAMLAHALLLETAVVTGMSAGLTPDILLRVARCLNLRQVTVCGSFDGRGSELARGHFQRVEVADLVDEGSQSELLQHFLTCAPTLLVRNLAITVRRRPSGISTAGFVAFIQSASRFVNLTRASFRTQISDMRHSDVKEQMQAVHNMLEPLTALHGLEELRIHVNRALTLPEPEHTTFFACWPQLQACSITSDIVMEGFGDIMHDVLSLSLSAFFDILVVCPRLHAFAGNLDCSRMPSEQSVTKLERQQHPFCDSSRKINWDVPSEEQSLEAVLHRAVPNFKFWNHFTFRWRAGSTSPKRRVLTPAPQEGSEKL